MPLPEPVEASAEALALKPYRAPLPADAPQAFAQAFERARADQRPMVIDFWAPWCGPCVQLKKQTMADPAVAKVLAGFEVVFVNLDEHPQLAQAYGVNSIPDLYFVNAQGLVVDRLLTFEEPGPFLERLHRLVSPTRQAATFGVKTAVPSSGVAKAMGLKNKVRLHGRTVTEVEPGSPAAQAGIAAGDVLLRMGANDLYSADDIADYLLVSAPGDVASLLLKRPGEAEPRKVQVTLGGRKVVAAKGPQLTWQFSSLGQLPAALDAARAQHKKLLVGLSGAET